MVGGVWPGGLALSRLKRRVKIIGFGKEEFFILLRGACPNLGTLGSQIAAKMFARGCP